MTINISKVKSILKAGSVVKFNRNNIRDDSETIIPGEYDMKVHDRYRMAVAKVTGTTLELTGIKDNDLSANSVNIIFEEGCATMGSVLSPGILYSDSFSGCVFYLYRDPIGHIIGVHANRSSGKLADPDSWFIKRGGKCIYKWDSKGLVKPPAFGTVVVCLDKTVIDIYALEVKGQTIQRVIEHNTIKNWPSVAMI